MIGENRSLIHTVIGRYRMDILRNEVGTVEVFNKAMAMTGICRSGITSLALFLFLHASLLSTIFKEAGHSLNFVFGIAGVTNSRKTSLVLAMTKIFDLENMVADAEFATATACGIEKTLGKYKDAVVIIDDFKPGVTIAQQRKMDEKLDQLIRFYGNRVSKKRMLDFAADENKKFFPIYGGCVVTMEIVTGVLSSMSRMFITEIGNQEVDNEKLAFYQQEKMLLPTHVYDFLRWATGRFENIILYIKQCYPNMRANGGFKLARHNEMYALFMVTASILSWYASERGFWQNEQCQEFLAEVHSKIMIALNCLAVRLQGMDKGRLVIQAFGEAMKNAKIIPVWLTEDTAADEHDFYEDTTYFYVRCRELRRITNEYCRQYQEAAEIINEEELLGILEKLDLLEIYMNGKSKQRSRKLPVQRGNRLRYAWIKKDALSKYEEE